MSDKKGKCRNSCNCDNRSITFQIAMGVIGTLSIIFLLLVIVISVRPFLNTELNVFFLNRETQNRIETQLEKIYCKNLEDLGKEGSASIDVIRSITSKLLAKMGIMTSDILDPSVHWPNGHYPLLTSSIDISERWNCNAPGCDSSQVHFTSVPDPTASITDSDSIAIIQKIIVLETVWHNSLQLKMGPERKIELSYMFFYFDTVDNAQSNFVLTQGQLSNLNQDSFKTLIEKFESNTARYNGSDTSHHLFLPMIQDPFLDNSDELVIPMMKSIPVPAPYTSSISKIYLGVMFKQTAFNYMIKILDGDQSTASSRMLELFLVQPPSEEGTISALVHSSSSSAFMQENSSQYKSLTQIDGFGPIQDVISQSNNEGVQNLSNCQIQGSMISAAGNSYYVSVRELPYGEKSNIDGYLILLQNQQELQDEIGSLSDKIRSDTIILTVCVLVVCLIVLIIIGAVVICYSKQISTPIQNLNKVVENIKKQSNRDDFYKTLKNQQIFKRIVDNKTPDSKKNFDEIDRLIDIFYQFFVGEKNNEAKDDSQKEAEGDRLFVTKYKYYPNLYYNKDSDNEQDDEKEDEFDQRKDTEKKYEIQEEEKESPPRVVLRQLDDDSPEMKLLPLVPKGGEIELQGLEKDEENEKQFDYAANIEKTKKLIKKLTKSHKPIKIDWNDLLEKVKDVDNANNRVIKDT